MGKMKLTLGVVGLLVGSIGSAYAGVIPFPDGGTAITIATYGFTATSTGTLDAYFYGSTASDTDYLQISIDGGPVSQFFENKTTAAGTEESFAVIAGETVTLSLYDANTKTTLTATTSNADGDNHAYVTPYSGAGPAGIPAGTLIAFEDRLKSQGSDFRYNDEQVVITDLSDPVPELSTWAMMGLGFGALGFAGLRVRKTIVANA